MASRIKGVILGPCLCKALQPLRWVVGSHKPLLRWHAHRWLDEDIGKGGCADLQIRNTWKKETGVSNTIELLIPPKILEENQGWLVQSS